jgi:hypothetical protein
VHYLATRLILAAYTLVTARSRIPGILTLDSCISRPEENSTIAVLFTTLSNSLFRGFLFSKLYNINILFTRIYVFILSIIWLYLWRHLRTLPVAEIIHILLPKNVIQNCNFACFFMGVNHSLSLTLMEEHGRRLFENGVLRQISGTDRNEVTGDWDCIMRCFMICTPRQTFFGWQIKKSEIDGHEARMGRGEVQFDGGDLRQRGNLEDSGVGGRIILR